MSFIHLHTHSHYSLLQGLSKIEDIVKKAKKNRMNAVALTDHGNLYGAVSFSKIAKRAEIKPIIGIDSFISEGPITQKESGPENRTFHLVLLAENNKGYKNLIKLSSMANLDGFYHRPRIDKNLLRKFGEGLIALSGDIGGEVARALWNNNVKEALRVIREYKDIFGDENFFIEIMHHPEIERHDEITNGLIKLAKETKTPLVAAQGSYYTEKNDKEAHRTLLAVQSTYHLGEQARYFSNEADFSFIDSREAKEKFKKTPEAMENTIKIADRCNVDIKANGWIFPEIEIPTGVTHFDQLKQFVYEGVPERGLSLTPLVKKRIEHELNTINDKGFVPYFLVVSDLMYFARKNKILTTIRGSVAGSLITYLLKITNVNPLEYDLPFERFLNPERPSAPDIDMDFADDRRDEVIEYARQKYGADKVAQIGTFGTMLARGVVRDVARALGYPYGTGDRIAKLIPFGSQGFPMTIDKAFKLVPELREAYEKEKDTKEIIDLSKKLEGCARHVSVHAAGVVITPKPLTEYVPLQRDPKGYQVITQYDMYSLEDIGLIKFDFLGIRNLAILSRAVDLVKKLRNVDVNIENIPLDDKKTFKMLSRGETMGLFQLGGSAMTKFLIDLKPTRIDDIMAMVALYRPGPMKNIPEYIARKHGKKPVTFFNPKMKKFLKNSYGILVYQDDILSTALEVAGYSWKTVDKFRKAVGKKIPEEMAKQHVIFVEGCIKHSGLKKDEAEELWKLFEPFQGYGFNKAHAACYGRVAYQTAYMKANFPAEYMTAVLSAESGDIEEIARIVAECKRMEIEVLPPDINESYGDFTVIKSKEEQQGPGHTKSDERDKIRFGLSTTKNLGEEISHAIIEERKKNGKFKSLADFLDKVQHQNLNRRSLEALIKSGSMDSLGERGQMMNNIEETLLYNRENIKKGKDQSSIFALIDDNSVTQLKLRESEPATTEEKYTWEKEFLGLYLSGHPLDKHRERFLNKPSIKEHKNFDPGRSALCGGIIDEVRTVTTRRGEQMAFVQLSDFSDSVEVVFFPKDFERFKSFLVADVCVAISGKISNRNDTPSIIAEKIKLL